MCNDTLPFCRDSLPSCVCLNTQERSHTVGRSYDGSHLLLTLTTVTSEAVLCALDMVVENADPAYAPIYIKAWAHSCKMTR